MERCTYNREPGRSTDTMTTKVKIGGGNPLASPNMLAMEILSP